MTILGILPMMTVRITALGLIRIAANGGQPGSEIDGPRALVILSDKARGRLSTPLRMVPCTGLQRPSRFR